MPWKPCHYVLYFQEYSEELKHDFPKDLNAFCRDLGKVLGFPEFNAEAAIVNTYHKDSSLNGHTDHSELNLDAPLFSLRFVKIGNCK